MTTTPTQTTAAIPAENKDSAILIPDGHWTLDSVHSSFAFSVRHMGVAKFRGYFTEVDAAMSTSAGAIAIEGSAAVGSVTTADPNLHGHLQSADFFDAANHPNLVLKSDSVHLDGDSVTVQANLEMRGVAHPVTLSGTVTGPLDDPYGNERLGFELETTIDRTKWGLAWNAPLPGGGLVLSNKVKINADVEFIRQS